MSQFYESLDIHPSENGWPVIVDLMTGLHATLYRAGGWQYKGTITGTTHSTVRDRLLFTTDEGLKFAVHYEENAWLHYEGEPICGVPEDACIPTGLRMHQDDPWHQETDWWSSKKPNSLEGKFGFPAPQPPQRPVPDPDESSPLPFLTGGLLVMLLWFLFSFLAIMATFLLFGS